MENYFAQLNAVDVGEHIEEKNGLSYLSWAWAWAEVKKRFPDANYKIYENESGWFYHTDGKTCWVKTGVTVNGIEHVEMLPVMDFKNRSISLENVTSTDVNKAIQRSLTKACARHGLGLYIYAGEDLPEGAEKEETPAAPKFKETCTVCGKIIEDTKIDGKLFASSDIIKKSMERHQRVMCTSCMAALKANKPKGA